jgi:hypothetical protein
MNDDPTREPVGTTGVSRRDLLKISGEDVAFHWG